MAQHTSPPWVWEEGSPDVLRNWNGKNCVVAQVVDPVWHENKGSAGLEAAANAAFIVQAVNAHDDLVATLQMAKRLLSQVIGPEHAEWDEMKAICAALLKAEAM